MNKRNIQTKKRDIIGPNYIALSQVDTKNSSNIYYYLFMIFVIIIVIYIMIKFIPFLINKYQYQYFSNKKTASRRSPVRRSGRQNFSNKKEKFSIDGYNNKEYYSI